MNSISTHRFCCIVVMLLLFCSVRAERPDSVLEISQTDTIPAYLIPGGIDAPEFGAVQNTSLVGYPSELLVLQSTKAIEMPTLRLRGLASPSIFSWRGGGLSIENSSADITGMMGLESGNLNLQQSIGSLTLSLWGGATKYGYFRGMQTSWGFGGSLDYRINDRWSLTLFGEYHSPINAITPGMAGYMNTSRFGGYASYNFNEHWGISVGAQTQQSVFTNGWEVQPIVMPYYRINKDVKLGIDVGGIMYHMVRDWVDGRRQGVGNPTIGPIRQGPPPVAPRR